MHGPCTTHAHDPPAATAGGATVSESEERLAWLEREVADLSSAVARQDSELRALRTAVDRLTAEARARAAEGGGGAVMGDERPPHW